MNGPELLVPSFELPASGPAPQDTPPAVRLERGVYLCDSGTDLGTIVTMVDARGVIVGHYHVPQRKSSEQVEEFVARCWAELNRLDPA